MYWCPFLFIFCFHLWLIEFCSFIEFYPCLERGICSLPLGKKCFWCILQPRSLFSFPFFVCFCIHLLISTTVYTFVSFLEFIYRVVWAFFFTFFTNTPSFTFIYVMSVLVSFIAPERIGNKLFYPFRFVAILYFWWDCWQIKNQNVCVDNFIIPLYCDSFHFCHSSWFQLFSCGHKKIYWFITIPWGVLRFWWR